MNQGCHHCKWARGDFSLIRNLFRLPCAHPYCNLDKHPLFKERRYDHRGRDCGIKNTKLIFTIAKEIKPNVISYEIREDCLLNIKFECPFWHKRYTKFTKENLEDLKEELKLRYAL